jgi:hypothetical protein
MKMKEDEKRKIKVRESRKMYKERYWLENEDEENIE